MNKFYFYIKNSSCDFCGKYHCKCHSRKLIIHLNVLLAYLDSLYQIAIHFSHFIHFISVKQSFFSLNIRTLVEFAQMTITAPCSSAVRFKKGATDKLQTTLSQGEKKS